MTVTFFVQTKYRYRHLQDLYVKKRTSQYLTIYSMNLNNSVSYSFEYCYVMPANMIHFCYST